jgi:hypothetical protein
VIVPFWIVQNQLLPACETTDAVKPVVPAAVLAGAVMTGVAGAALTTTAVVPAGEMQPAIVTVTL